jgi:HEAT repeat protein
VNSVWPQIFTLPIQQCIESIELQFGEALLPVSFNAFKHGFAHLTSEKITRYQTAVLECKHEIEVITAQYKDNPHQLKIAATQKLRQLGAETNR